MNTFTIKRSFAFFNQRIGSKFGEKCCRYNQNGKPLPADTVDQQFDQLKEYLDGWQVNEDRTRLFKLFYARDYLMAVQFIKDIAKMDALESKNCPSFEIKGGDFVKVELYSPSLNGLSQIDFQNAMNINNIKFEEEYYMVPVMKAKNYRREATLKLREKDSLDIQAQLKVQEGSAKKEAASH